MQKLNVLILGQGGREHAFATAILKSALLDNLFAMPGNAGIGTICTCLDGSLSDFESIARHCLSNHINLVVVGPEQPLVDGIVDYFNANNNLKHILILGPNSIAAQLEGSKDFSKQLMHKYGIPTAPSATFTAETIDAARLYVANHSLPVVIKADGLAAGKGVIIAETTAIALSTLDTMLLNNSFGIASDTVVIEQYLKGTELSMFVLTDAETYLLLPEAKDYKRIGEGDTGPNTGGMGAVSPVPFATSAFKADVESRIVKPLIKALKQENITYQGFIFIGIMVDLNQPNPIPYVIEFNARMGDPETEVVLPRITSDVLAMLYCAASGTLASYNITQSNLTAVTVVTVAEGYPDAYQKGETITYLPQNTETQTIYHAGTKNHNNLITTNGGSLLAETAMGTNLPDTAAEATALASAITYKGKYFRTDIGQDLIALDNLNKG